MAPAAASWPHDWPRVRYLQHHVHRHFASSIFNRPPPGNPNRGRRRRNLSDRVSSIASRVSNLNITSRSSVESSREKIKKRTKKAKKKARTKWKEIWSSVPVRAKHSTGVRMRNFETHRHMMHRTKIKFRKGARRVPGMTGG